MTLRTHSNDLLLILPILAMALHGCGDDGSTDASGTNTETSDTGDGDPTTGDGDGEPTTTGDGDGDPTTGDGDGDPTTGDGDPTTGDGDGDPVELSLVGMDAIGVYETGVFDDSGAEIVAFDPTTDRLFVTSSATASVEVLDLSDPTAPTLVDSFDVTPYGDSPNSVDVRDGLVAVAVAAVNHDDPGVVVFFDAGDLSVVNDLQVGVLPDMLTFSPDGDKLLAACEGEPDDDYLSDPEGSIAIIDVSGDVGALADNDVQIADFNAFDINNIDPDIRIFGPGSSVAQDVEPEYIAVSSDSSTAWVALQENNALAVLDIDNATVTGLVALGFKDHSQPGAGLDPSDDDEAIAIGEWPVWGMYQPDSIVRFTVDGADYIFSANEGDGRGYDAFDEESRVEDLSLDPTAFPDAAMVQMGELLGRLTVTTVNGDVDDDGDYDELYAFGTRSVSVWGADGTLVWDSGDQLEQQTAMAYPDDFNSNNDANDSFESRSDNKGPEPEGAVAAELWGSPYVFAGLERVGGIVAYDVSDPKNPSLVYYDNSTRDFSGVAADGTAGDLGPEGLEFVAAADSPNAEPLLIVGNEVSGTVRVYQLLGE